MKKLTFMAAMAVAAATMVSCSSNNPKVSLKSDLDSLSYAFGVAQGADLQRQMEMGQLPVDSAYLSDFVKGVNEGFNAGDNKKKQAYLLGTSVGQYLTNMTERIDNNIARFDSTTKVTPQTFLAGFVNTFLKKNQQLKPEQADSVLTVIMTRLQEESLEKNYASNREAGVAYLASIEQQPGVQKTESGLLYKVVKEGNGEKPAEGAKVKVNYEGKLIDGTVFDSSYQRGEPAEFSLGGVIPGFREALQLMPVGSEWEVYIPQELAYGAQEAGQIKPFSALTFKLELIDIVK